ncbi:MAG: peptide-methionine (S)-S-oxide reductase [Rhodobacteraceae bacterium]|nr:MAG: peptide-methionine (S)-S-oxide reductase [Paracoccaceae bacterium]
MLRMVLAMVVGLAGSATAETAIVAGGCFWCVEADFESVKGVSEVVSGYTGGDSANPTYRNHEGHYEAVEITFDPGVISYGEVIAKFLRSVDVLDAGGQFCDRGDAYRTAIFVQDTAQRKAAEAAVAEAEQVLGQKIVTPVLNAGQFWIAEDYHQDYYKGAGIILTRAGPKKQSNAYKFYRKSCGRDARVRELWGAEALTH